MDDGLVLLALLATLGRAPGEGAVTAERTVCDASCDDCHALTVDALLPLSNNTHVTITTKPGSAFAPPDDDAWAVAVVALGSRRVVPIVTGQADRFLLRVERVHSPAALALGAHGLAEGRFVAAVTIRNVVAPGVDDLGLATVPASLARCEVPAIASAADEAVGAVAAEHAFDLSALAAAAVIGPHLAGMLPPTPKSQKTEGAGVPTH